MYRSIGSEIVVAIIVMFSTIVAVAMLIVIHLIMFCRHFGILDNSSWQKNTILIEESDFQVKNEQFRSTGAKHKETPPQNVCLCVN